MIFFAISQELYPKVQTFLKSYDSSFWVIYQIQFSIFYQKQVSYLSLLIQNVKVLFLYQMCMYVESYMQPQHKKVYLQSYKDIDNEKRRKEISDQFSNQLIFLLLCTTMHNSINENILTFSDSMYQQIGIKSRKGSL